MKNFIKSIFEREEKPRPWLNGASQENGKWLFNGKTFDEMLDFEKEGLNEHFHELKTII